MAENTEGSPDVTGCFSCTKGWCCFTPLPTLWHLFTAKYAFW